MRVVIYQQPARRNARREASFELALEGPLEPVSSLEMFRRHGDDLLDRWDGRLLVRTIFVGTRQVAFTSEFFGTLSHPKARVTVEDARCIDEISECVRTTFVTPPPDYRALAAADPVIGALDRRYEGFRPVLQPNLLGAMIRCISAQQVNLRWAATGRRRLAEAFGHRHSVGGNIVHSLDPARLAALSIADIRALQFTNRKAEYIINLARIFAAGELTIEDLRNHTDDAVIAALVPIRGIGLWTAEWVLARVLGRPRVVAGDLGVRKAVGLAYFNGHMPSEEEVRGATVHWGDSTALVQALLLHGLAEKTLHSPAPAEPLLSLPATKHNPDGARPSEGVTMRRRKGTLPSSS
ncbi:MAG: DNA-3-methyladenine glycosylase family protein [Candidatus Binataceae bacterium]